ncbi:NACHT domain-containing NTPase [Tolypothrix sp. PCC 7910]|uniref:NACHT domain-containing protein n=1 Tax=Tolypothrix sp. PCC 7910 TaxID=2099387 RepID=UPI0014279E64|nr:NACHT domain-containing NTPase [Tolypothrix sp. PCC 7910]QIR36890.1 NACHT domain-containing NTPase [Tolypothrix sp. PCC 7910]
MSLPKNFLTQLEQYSELSNREKAVFVEIFGNGKSRVQVTQALNISDSNLSSCLTGIYKKFSINGSGPVKETRLREYLEKRYSQQKPSGGSIAEVAEDDIDALVQEIREQVKPSIKEKCGTMRVLDMPQPIELTGERGIYTNVNILEKITGRRRLDISELLQDSNPDNFERFGLNRVKEKRIPGIEVVKRHHKLMVLGKPGAGKSTFLKYLAMQCIEGQYLTNRVPLFITLKDFAETPKQPDVLEYIAQKLAFCGVKDASIRVDQLLRQGKVLVLLDGLDEVREEDTKRVLRQIRDISDQFHTNQFVITCRIAAKEYTFERFTEVEVADFDEEQIAIFSQNWFRLSDQVKSEKFIQKLKDNEPIHELATNPLLLTLLCLVFGESADFPMNRSELYKEGVDVLLKKWDAKRNIERDEVYKNLSLHRKVDLLSQIALTTFENKDYFFKQKTIEAYIFDFISNLRDSHPDPDVLKLDSEAVLKSIEAQHGLLVERAKGIYSFSHLTFQEYFTAREIVATFAWEKLLEHITERRWYEVFLLTVSMMRKADNLLLLMKQKIDEIVANDEKLQQLLFKVNNKSLSIKSTHKPVAVRAFYFEHALFFSYDCLYELTYEFAAALGLDSNAIHTEQEIAFDESLSDILEVTNVNKYEILSYILNLQIYIEPELRQLIQDLKEIFQLKNQENCGQEERLSPEYNQQLRSLLIKYRDICYKDELSEHQNELLWCYYDANEMLLNCLNND